MRLTWFGTASLAVEAGEDRLLIDPFFPMRGSPTRVEPSAYDGYAHILATHGHFDHILNLPEIVQRSGAQIYCTRTPRDTLLNNGVPARQIREIAPGDDLQIGGMRVTVYASCHVKYDKKLLVHTFLNLRMLKYARNLPLTVRVFRSMPENGETVAFRIEADGHAILVLGSLNLLENVDYPTGADVLVLPYQGTSDLLTPGLRIVERLKPKAVLLDHFDDAFPPVSGAIDPSDIVRALEGKIPVWQLAPGQSIQI